MGFREKYTTDVLLKKDPSEEKDKVVISPDAFSQGDMIEELINKIEHARSSLVK